MNNKKKLTFLSVILASALIMAACNAPKTGGDSSSAGPDTSSVEPGSSGEEASSSSQDPAPSSSSQAPGTSSSSSSSSAAAVELVSISVKAPTKVNYTTADTALDLAGMVVTAQYSDQSSKTISTGYTVSTVDFSTPGPKTVTVTYQNKTATFSITVAEQKFTVKFVVDGAEVQTGQVVKGQYASYTGNEPTKAGDAENVKYRFIGWDKDPAKTAITQDTTFTAQFQPYAAEVMVDDFESYDVNADVLDANWVAIGWSNETNGWSENTKAAVSLGTKSVEGNKALRFDAWRNGSAYKIAKKFPTNTYTKSVNAMKFRLMVPANCDVSVILYLKPVTIAGQSAEPVFYYPLTAASSEYVEYTIPLADPAWDLWKEGKGNSIAAAAEMLGMHQDDIMSQLTKIEISIKGTVANNLPYIAFLDSLKFVTLDNPAKGEVETMGQYNRYTGLLADGHTVRIDLGANGAATATVLDAAEQQQQIPGNVAIDANKQMTFTSADGGATLVYTGKLVNGGQSIKYVSASGAFANAVANMQLDAVQVVDNYDQYTSDGKSYYQSNLDINNRSGCRGAYYSEYYSGGPHDYETFGGNGWVLMAGDGSQLKMKTDGGHSGNNYLCLKNSSGAAMRYMQWGLFDGTSEQNNFRGSKLSFWAKTNGVVKSFKVSMYSQTKPRNATKDEQVRSEPFTQTEAIGQWKHFEVNLNPDLTYYGFLIFMEKTGGSDAYLYIDDVEVYTANPYAQYVPPVVQQQPQNGQVFCGKALGLAPVTIAIGKDNKARLGFEMMSVNEEVTYTINEDKISFDCGSLGSFVAQMNSEATELTYVSGTGTVADFAANVTFAKMDILDNAESYTESGKMYYQSNKDVNNRSGARGAYICDYYTNNANDSSPLGGSKWNLMGGSGDQLSLETSIVHSGANSLKLKRNYGATMRYATWGLMDGTAEGHTGASYFMYWVKNPNAKAATIKTSVYYQQTVTPSTQQSNRAYVEASIPANADWTPVVIPLDPAKTYYGVAYSVANPGGSGSDFLYVDDAMFFSEEMNVAAPFGVKEGLALSGTLQGGIAASMTFGKNNKVTLTCEALGGDVACTFTLIGNTLTIKVPALQQGGSGTTIVGTYGPVAMQNSVSFTVTSCTGDMATYIAADTVFQGSVA